MHLWGSEDERASIAGRMEFRVDVNLLNVSGRIKDKTSTDIWHTTASTFACTCRAESNAFDIIEKYTKHLENVQAGKDISSAHLQ